MRDFLIRPSDVFEIIERHRKAILLTFAAAFSFVMFIFTVVPRTYQSEAIVHIGVNYFQNPLIGDLVSQTYDPGELRSEREKIIKASLGVDFAGRMGEKYKLFKTDAKDPARAIEVEWFLKSLDISPVTSTQFRIKYKARTPETADGVIRAAIEAIREYMFVTRVQMLEQFFGVLSSEISQSSDGTQASSPLALGGARSDAARAQITAQINILEKRLIELQRSYNEQHPSIQAVKSQIGELKSVEKAGALAPQLTRRKVFSGSAPNSNIREDLSKQKHLLNISLEMERKDPSMASYVSLVKEPVFPKKPFFPKMRMFLLFALVAGVMVSTLSAAVLEFWERTLVSPSRIAKKLNVPVIGRLSLEKSAS